MPSGVVATLHAPILQWLWKYDWREDIFGDIVAAVTVFILLVPQGIAYSLLAEMPPVYGLYTATVPLLVYAVFGTSRHISMGPFAITCLLIGNATAKYGFDIDSREQAVLVRTITLLHSVFTLCMGIFKLGVLSNFLSHSVLTGFVSGSACIIILNQLKYILGLKVPRFSYTLQTLGYLLTHMDKCNWISIVISAFSLALLYSAKRFKQSNRERIRKSMWLKVLLNSSSLMCIVAGTTTSYCTFGKNGDLQIVGYVPPGFMPPSIEISPSLVTVISLVPSSFIISIISFAGCYAIAKKFSAVHKYDVDATQELLAQGLSSLIGLLLVNSFVVSGGLARSAVNVESGAKTQLSGIITATLMIIALLSITSYFFYIPMAVLGSVIIISVSSMIDFDVMWDAWRIDRRDFCVMASTFLITFFIGIVEGVSVGVVLSMVFVLNNSAFPQIVHLGCMQGIGSHRNVYMDSARNKECAQVPGVAILRMDAPLSFVNCAHFKSLVHAAADGLHHTDLRGQPIRMVVLDVSMWGSPPDIAALQTLDDIHNELLEKRVQICFACARGPLRDRLSKAHFVEKVGAGFFFLSIEEAVDAAPSRRASISKELASCGHLSSVAVAALGSSSNSRSHFATMAVNGYLSNQESGENKKRKKKEKKEKKKRKMNDNNNNNNDTTDSSDTILAYDSDNADLGLLI